MYTDPKAEQHSSEGGLRYHGVGNYPWLSVCIRGPLPGRSAARHSLFVHLRIPMRCVGSHSKANPFIGLMALVMLLLGCARPECQNTNPVFDQHAPGSEVYTEELLDQLQKRDPNDVRWWVDTYEGRNGAVFIHFFVQGGDLCAKAVMTIPPDREKKHREKKGNWKNGFGAHGAEVIGLKYDVVRTDGKTELVFRGWDRMID